MSLSDLLERFRPEPPPPAELKLAQQGRKIAVFSRQLATLLNAGVQLVRSLSVLEEQHEDPILAKVLHDVSNRVQGGHSFSKVLSRYSRLFPPVFVGLVAVGEKTGGLIQCIIHLADMLEREEQLNQKVKGALTYPAFILGITGLLTIVLFKTVLPGFMDFFRNFGVPLPIPTRVLMILTDSISSYLFWTILILAALAARTTIKRALADQERRVQLYSLFIKVPGVGKIFKYAGLARYCWVLQMSVSTGLDILRSLALASSACGDPVLAVDLKRTQNCIRDGLALSETLRARPDLYPRLLVQMVVTAEESSDYASAFTSAGKWFEQEVDDRVEVFKASLEPILMAVVAVLVGGIVLSIFLPLYGFLDKLGG